MHRGLTVTGTIESDVAEPSLQQMLSREIDRTKKTAGGCYVQEGEAQWKIGQIEHGTVTPEAAAALLRNATGGVRGQIQITCIEYGDERVKKPNIVMGNFSAEAFADDRMEIGLDQLTQTLLESGHVPANAHIKLTREDGVLAVEFAKGIREENQENIRMGVLLELTNLLRGNQAYLGVEDWDIEMRPAG